MVTNINIYFNKFINYLKLLNSSNRLLRYGRNDGTKTKKSQPYSRDFLLYNFKNLLIFEFASWQIPTKDEILLDFFKNNDMCKSISYNSMVQIRYR